ncbi:MAG: dihydroorotase [Christensenella sp.]
MSILIKNVTVVNADCVQEHMDILVDKNKIANIARHITAQAERIIDGTGLSAFAGFLDLHCHLREPGFTHKEDIITGTRAAAAGGYTAVCAMPNTSPVTDNAETINYIREKSEQYGYADVLPVAAITCGMKGKTLTDFGKLLKEGAAAFSDDGMPVDRDEVIIAAMTRAKELGALLMLHEENLELRGAGVVNAGKNAIAAGLVGIPRAVEESMTARDIFYAAKLGAPIHICHVSTAGSVELVRRAKKNGAPVTCETAPHYYSITDEMILNKNANAKVNPPLREKADIMAVREGIADGTIDVIATDHAPHSEKEKAQKIENAPFGMIGFETAFALTVTNLLNTGVIKLTDVARLLTRRPHELLHLEGGVLKKNVAADITICDLNEKFVYNNDMVVSKANNSPFLGMELTGRVCYTIRKGKFTYDRQAD